MDSDIAPGTIQKFARLAGEVGGCKIIGIAVKPRELEGRPGHRIEAARSAQPVFDIAVRLDLAGDEVRGKDPVSEKLGRAAIALVDLVKEKVGEDRGLRFEYKKAGANRCGEPIAWWLIYRRLPLGREVLDEVIDVPADGAERLASGMQAYPD